MRTHRFLEAMAVVALQSMVPAYAQTAQQIRPPIALYWMSVDTSGAMGVSIPAGFGGLLPSSMQGGKRMKLDLGSSQAPDGEPRASHAIPPRLAMGDALPLVTPRIERAPAPSRPEPAEGEMHTPKGRMLIYWGCGETVRSGQPVLFDFAKMDP